MTSPADIEVHRKVELQDADITEAQQKAFKDLMIYFLQIQVIWAKPLYWK